jgi:outer membrane protein TolC
MLKRLASLAGLLTLTWVSVASAQELTLNEVVRLSLARNERSKIASLSVTSADASLRRARAAFMPTVSLGAGETFRPYTAGTNLRSTSASGSLTVNQPLVTVTAFPLYAGAKHSFLAAQHTELDQRQQLASDAAQAFFAVIAQQRIAIAAQNRLERADASLADTRARAQAELVSSNDVTRSVIEHASSVQSVASAEASLAQARVTLGNILDVEVADDLVAPSADLAPFGLDEPELMRLAIAQRPDLKASNESLAAAQALADEPGLRFVPSLTASGQARVADQPIAGPRYIDETVALNLNWSIWDAGVRSADSDSRNAAAQTSEFQRRALVRQIRLQVRQAVIGLVASRSSLVAAQDGLTAAQQNVQETDVLYKQGLAKAIELVDANASRFDAEVALAAAQLDLRRSEIDLRNALGLFPVDGVK